MLTPTPAFQALGRALPQVRGVGELLHGVTQRHQNGIEMLVAKLAGQCTGAQGQQQPALGAGRVETLAKGALWRGLAAARLQFPREHQQHAAAKCPARARPASA